MADYYKTGDCIECNSAEIIARKPVPSSFVKHPILGQLRKYTCERNSSAEIAQELNPKKSIYDPLSKLNMGDKIQAEKIIVYVANSVIRFSVLGGHSGRHKSQYVKTKCFTYAKITFPFRHILNALKELK